MKINFYKVIFDIDAVRFINLGALHLRQFVKKGTEKYNIRQNLRQLNKNVCS